jgi:positive regulator of sigma E activity
MNPKEEALKKTESFALTWGTICIIASLILTVLGHLISSKLLFGIGVFLFGVAIGMIGGYIILRLYLKVTGEKS